MHTRIPYQKNEEQRKERQSRLADIKKSGIPNSVMLSMLSGRDDSGGMPIDELGKRVMARLPSVQQRAQAQIPRAEAEADRLSASVSAGSPESVKANMGRRMGADFSGVRFHTGAAASAKADAMGARAYTSGADVYFGTGGFDAAVAAHELVHTAQQGMVSSGVETMSTPVGGVQMVTAGGTGASAAAAQSKRERAKNWFKGAAGTVRGAADTVKENTWDKTGGRLIRKHHDAMDELHHAQGGDWAALTPEEQASWKRHNPLAYLHYTRSAGARAATGTRIGDRARELDQAKTYLGDHASELSAKSSMLYTEPATGTTPASPAAPRLAIGYHEADKGSFGRLHPTVGDAVETGAFAADEFVRTPLDIAQSIAETANAAEKGTSDAGAFGGALGIATGAVGAVSAVGDISEAVEDKHAMGIVDSSVDLVGNAAQIGSGAAAIGRAALTDGSGAAEPTVNAFREIAGSGAVSDTVSVGSGAAEAAKDAVAGLDIVSGAANMYLGGRDIYKGANKGGAMKDFQNTAYAGKTRNDLEGEDLLLHDMATLGGMEGRRQVTAGAGKAITGAMDTVAGGLELGGVTAGAGLGVKGASAATKTGFALADHLLRRRMKKAVVEQTTGITDQKIRDFQKEKGITSFSRAKQAVMKAKGYGTGQQEEAFADQTTKRGQYLAKQANSTGPGNEKARKLAEGLGTVKKEGKFEAGRLAEAMGKRKSRGEIISRKHRIKHMLSRRPAATTTPPLGGGRP